MLPPVESDVETEAVATVSSSRGSKESTNASAASSTAEIMSEWKMLLSNCDALIGRCSSHEPDTDFAHAISPVTRFRRVRMTSSVHFVVFVSTP